MISEDYEHSWSQHFPTYNFKERDIVLEEYRVAAKNVESEERIFLNASNITLIASAGLGSLIMASFSNSSFSNQNIFSFSTIIGLFLFLTIAFSIVTIRYFADRQKSIVFAARKVIVLRRMLGLGYGGMQLVLPNWRIEGADEPFAIRMFPGWNTYVVYPYSILALISSAVILSLITAFFEHKGVTVLFLGYPVFLYIVLITLFWGILLGYIYRKALLDTHERITLLFARNLSKALNLKIVGNFEYIIYRSILARHEMQRLKINTVNLNKLLVFIEDKSFYSHKGISLKGQMRALLGVIGIKRRSGGSTITQQLSRTLYINDLSKTIRRKIVEMILAVWMERVFTKDDLLGMYLSSVRFERGVYGVIEAMKFYWGDMIFTPSKAEAFFLIERVSNIRSQFLTDKIIQTINNSIQKGVMDDDDVIELINLYVSAVSERKIIDNENGVRKLNDFFNNLF